MYELRSSKRARTEGISVMILLPILLMMIQHIMMKQLNLCLIHFLLEAMNNELE
jgi:hypothetical protein